VEAPKTFTEAELRK
jgi:centrin-3